MRFTDEEILLIRQEYQKEFVDLKGLQKTFNHRHLTSNISRKARLLGLQTKYKRKESPLVRKNYMKKPEMFDFIKLNYSTMSNIELSKLTGYSVSGLEKIANAWGFENKNIKEKWVMNKHPKGMLNRNHSEKTKNIISQNSKKMWADENSYVNSDEYRQKISDRASHFQQNGIFKNRYSNSKKGYYDINGKKIFLRSAWEANYALYLDFLIEQKMILSWEYEKDVFWFNKIKRGVRSYLPDFKVINPNESISYHEVKGWMDAKSKTKLRRMKKYYPNIEIVLINDNAYKDIKRRFGKILSFFPRETD